MESPLNIAVQEKELDRLLTWIKLADSRMSLILPLSTAMLGVLAVLAPGFSSWKVLPAITSAFALFFLLLSILFSALASFPRTTGPKGSLVYFGGIASMELEQYRAACNGLTPEQYFADLVSQCHRNAQIAEKKYMWLQRAMSCLFASALPWVISVYTLYTLKP